MTHICSFILLCEFKAIEIQNRGFKMEKKESNYDLMSANARKRFLHFDQDAIIRKFKLLSDPKFIYLSFVNRLYRINRDNGMISGCTDYRCQEGASGDGTAPEGIIPVTLCQEASWHEAGFNETLAIFDMLCHGDEFPVLSGNWESISSLGGIIGAGHSNSTMLDRYTAPFTGKVQELSEACRTLGGTPQKSGDVSFLLPVFDFFPVWFQFWDGDEEYPASIRFLWDKNTLRYLHYETLWYIMLHILERLREGF